MKDQRQVRPRPDKPTRRAVGELGMAAYIKLYGFRCLGRKGRDFFFEVDETELNQFDQLMVDYINSPMHEFDSAIMSLKKMPQYVEE